MSEASPRVALVKGDGRYANVTKALELIEGDIHLEGAEKILIKLNLISIARPLAITHIDAVRALLDFLQERTSCRIIIGESIEACARTFKPHPSFRRQLNWRIPDVENYL